VKLIPIVYHKPVPTLQLPAAATSASAVVADSASSASELLAHAQQVNPSAANASTVVDIDASKSFEVGNFDIGFYLSEDESAATDSDDMLH